MFKKFDMEDLSDYWRPEVGEYLIEVVGNDFVTRTYKNRNTQEQEEKVVMSLQVCSVQELPNGKPFVFKVPKLFETSSISLKMKIQEIINRAADERRDTIYLQLRKEPGNKYTVFEYTVNIQRQLRGGKVATTVYAG